MKPTPSRAQSSAVFGEMYGAMNTQYVFGSSRYAHSWLMAWRAQRG